jgi:hypothetical protein
LEIGRWKGGLMAAFLLVRGAVLHDRTSQPNRSSNPPVVIGEQREISHNSNAKLFSLAEAAPTPPGCRAWEPGLLDKTTYGQSPANRY